jgi:hypothetical protein
MSEVEDVNAATYCNECQGPLVIPTVSDYDPTILYKRLHSIHCSNHPLIEDN